MPDYHLSKRADIDLDEIAEYTLETWGLNQARTYRKALIACLANLAENHSIGRSASEFSPNLKRFNFKAHAIFFEPMKNGIFVVRILSQQQDFERHL